MISLGDTRGAGPLGPNRDASHLAGTPRRNHRPRKKPRRSDPTSSPPSLSDRRLPQKAFQAQSLSRAKTPYPGYFDFSPSPWEGAIAPAAWTSTCILTGPAFSKVSVKGKALPLTNGCLRAGRPNRAESYGVRREDRQGVGGESPLR